MSVPAVARSTRMSSPAIMVGAAMGGLILVAGVVTAGAAFQILALALAAVFAAVIISRPEWGVFVLVSTFFMSYPAAFSGSGSLTINNVIGLLLAGVLAVRSLISRRLDVLDSSILRMLAVLWFLFYLNRLIADATPPFASLSALDLTDMRAADFVSKFWFVFFVIAFIRTRWQVTVFACALVLFVVITAPNAIYNALSAWKEAAAAMHGMSNIERMRAAADFGIQAARNANRLAFLCDLAIALLACAMLRLRYRWLMVLGWSIIGGLVICIFLSASRSGILNLLLLGIYFFSRITIPMRRVILGSMAVGAFAMLALQLVPSSAIPMSSEDAVRRAVATAAARNNIPSAYLDRITNFVMAGRNNNGVEASTENRLELIEIGLKMFSDHPFMGIGVGNFRWRSIVEYNNPHVSALHNSYVLTLTEGGVTMFAGYMVLFWIIWRTLRDMRRRATEYPEVGLAWLAEATQIMFVIFLIFSGFADCWHEAYLPFIASLIAVLARVYATHEVEVAQTAQEAATA